MNRSLPRVLLVAIAALLSGCGGGNETGTITGRVISKTKPLAGGTITFQVKDQPETAMTFPIGEDGSYKAENIPYGELQISIVAKSEATISVAVASAKAEMGRLDAAGQPVPQNVVNAANANATAAPATPTGIPAIEPKYADPLTSELTFTLESRTAEKNFDLP